MNTVQAEILINKLGKPADLINSLVDTEYSFALWSLPGISAFDAIIDIQNKNSDIASIEDATEAFALNSFSKSHPTSPIYIQSDIHFKSKSNKISAVRIKPEVSASSIDNFLSRKKNTSVRKKPSGYNNDFKKSIEKSIEKIKLGELDKVVISRYKDIELPDAFCPFDFFLKLNSQYPTAFCYLTYTPENGLWLGATPEKLIDVDYGKLTFSTDALAGTQPLKGRSLDQVAWTMKEIEEQAMVSRYIVDGFKKIRLREFDEIGPKTVKAANLAHLKTQFKVDMKTTGLLDIGSIMLDILHPTSAVCGFPRKEALTFINNTENYNRALYSGFLGPVKFNNSTNLFVNLRCMQVFDDSLRLFAGAGITQESNPEKEFEETEHKMNTLLSLIEKN